MYTVDIVTNRARREPEPNCDQLRQAVTVDLCLARAAVLLVLALVPGPSLSHIPAGTAQRR
jgi:hypothetical protein